MPTRFNEGPLHGLLWHDDESDQLWIGFEGPPGWQVAVYPTVAGIRKFENHYAAIGGYRRSGECLVWVGWDSGDSST